MSKRSALPGAFALPGLADKRLNSVGRVKALRTETETSSVEIETRRLLKTSSTLKNEAPFESCLMDERGEFLPQKDSGLKHLTKSRPKSPARRPANTAKRERSRSPDSTRDEFEYYAGLKHDTDLADTKSKQSAESQRSSTNYTSKIFSQQARNEPKHELVNTGTNNELRTELSTLNNSTHYSVDNTNMDSELSQDDDISDDDDLEDMLIADYIDSDDSYTENKPTSSPRQTNSDLKHNNSTKLFPSLRLTSESSKTVPSDTNARNTKKLFPSLPEIERDNSLSKNDTSVSASANPGSRDFAGKSHSTVSLIGSSSLSSQSSARRRRFKPVSIDNVESNGAPGRDSNKSSFPGRSLDSQMPDSNISRKEVDWGLRTSSLNSSFSESTLKSGTMFDKFLTRNKNIEKRGILREDNDKEKGESPVGNKHGNQQELVVHEPLRVVKMHHRNDSVQESEFKSNHIDKHLVQSSNNMLHSKETISKEKVIPAVHIDFDNDNNTKQKQSLSKLFSEENEDDDVSDIIENGSQCSNDDNYTYYIDDNDDIDNDDDKDDNDGKIYDLSTLITTTNRPPDGIADGTDTILNDELESDILSESDQELTTFNDSLGSVSDTHEMSFYSPGEIPQQYHHALNSSNNKLYPPPVWDTGIEMVESPDKEADNTTLVEDQRESSGDIGDIQKENEWYSMNEEMFREDVVIRPPGLFDEGGHVDLFEPPPMFASDEEEDELDSFDTIVPPPLPSLSPVQNKKVMPFHKIPLLDWTEEDALEWLKYVGLGHFKEQFKSHHVNGRTLKNIDFQLLEEIGISAPDERELVLAEIYELDHPSEEEHLEAEIQDALETASEQDKEKILAVLTALRSPTLNKSMELPVATDEQDSDQGYHLSSDTASLASSVTASDEQSHKGSSRVTPSNSNPSDLHLSDEGSLGQAQSKIAKEKSTRKLNKDKELEKTKKKTKKKEKKGFSKFWESLSIGHTSSKLTKVFGSKKFNPAMQYLLQAGPQGILRVWPTALSGQTKYCSFMVSMTTTSSQVVRMVLEKYDVVADPLRYYLCEVVLSKGGVDQALRDNDCPLTWQCRWNDPEKFRFEMRCHDEGCVRMLFEIDEYEGDLDYRSIAVSSKTPCKDVLPLIVKKYDLPGKVDEYMLMEVSEDNEDDRRVVVDHVCPLELQKAWSEPDHVFRLVRKRSTPAAVSIQRVQSLSEGCSELQLMKLPRTNSNVSSLRDGYDTDSTDHADNTSEEAGDLATMSKELEEVVMEVQDSISSQQAPQNDTGESIRVDSHEIEKHLENIKKKDEELLAKDKEIDELKKQRDELLEKENELLVWRMRNSELVEREEEVEKLRSSLLEKENHEQLQKEKELEELRMKCLQLNERNNDVRELEEQLEKSLIDMETSMNDKNEELEERNREIERLYIRNTELNEKIKKVEELQKKLEGFTEHQRDFEHLKEQSNKSTENEMLEAKVRQLESDKASLETELETVKNVMQQKLDSNNNNFDNMKLELEILENENCQFKRKLEDLQRRNQLLEKSSKLLDSLRQENQSLLAKTKETEELKKNIIRLTSQLREADNLRLNQGELDDLKLRLSICEAEKQQIQSRLDESERCNRTLKEDTANVRKLRERNEMLQQKVNKQEDVCLQLETLQNKAQDNQDVHQKYLQAQDVEKRLTRELGVKEIIIKQKDAKVEEMDKKIKAMTEAMKKMESKFSDQKEQRENLSRLLTVIKEKDPSLLRTLHRSIITTSKDEEDDDDEEWC